MGEISRILNNEGNSPFGRGLKSDEIVKMSRISKNDEKSPFKSGEIDSSRERGYIFQTCPNFMNKVVWQSWKVCFAGQSNMVTVLF